MNEYGRKLLEQTRDWLLKEQEMLDANNDRYPEKGTPRNPHFDYTTWYKPVSPSPCGSTCCILGHMKIIDVLSRHPSYPVKSIEVANVITEMVHRTGVSFPVLSDFAIGACDDAGEVMDISPGEAAEAVQNVLEHGEPLWEEIVTMPEADEEWMD